jgi:serine protease AprX
MAGLAPECPVPVATAEARVSVLHQRHRGVVATLLACALAAAVAPASGGAGAVSARTPQVRAIVALTGTAAVGAPGVRIVATLPGVRSEVVAGSAAAVARLARDPRVLGLRADARMRLAGHDNTAGSGVAAWDGLGGQAGRPNAGRGVTVALVDTGVSDTVALDRASGRLVDAVDTSPLIDLQPPVTTGPFTDGYGHGTFLASLIAGGPVGPGDRGVGVAPAATVDVVKVARADGTTSLSAVLAGLNWVALHAGSVQVANLALGLPTGGEWGADPLNLATGWVRAAGVLVVVAAGNTPGQVSDPGIDPRALTVGAADTTGDAEVAAFSGSGLVAGVRKPDLVAPGVGVLGLLPPSSLIAIEHPDAQQPSGLWRGSGTSEATAVTTGVAALYFADHPDASPLEAKAALRGATRPLRDAAAGTGLLHVADRSGRAGRAGTGEEAFDAVAWVSTPWAKAAALAASWAAASWARAASWAGSWDGDSWQAASWASAWCRAASWAAATWASAPWDSASWARAASWAAASWAADSWTAASWGDGGSR